MYGVCIKTVSLAFARIVCCSTREKESHFFPLRFGCGGESGRFSARGTFRKLCIRFLIGKRKKNSQCVFIFLQRKLSQALPQCMAVNGYRRSENTTFFGTLFGADWWTYIVTQLDLKQS